MKIINETFSTEAKPINCGFIALKSSIAISRKLMYKLQSITSRSHEILLEVVDRNEMQSDLVVLRACSFGATGVETTSEQQTVEWIMQLIQ